MLVKQPLLLKQLDELVCKDAAQKFTYQAIYMGTHVTYQDISMRTHADELPPAVESRGLVK